MILKPVWYNCFTSNNRQTDIVLVLFQMTESIPNNTVIYQICESGALPGKMLLVRSINNDKIDPYFRSG